jgi:hypothetical protein
MSRNALFLFVILVSQHPSRLFAQDRDRDTPRWMGHMTAASANAVFSGLAAGITQELKGGSFRDGFTRGALGGFVIYGGKRIAAENFSGAGFLGRQIAGVGTSMVHNAADAIGIFDRLVAPVGIARIYWSRKPPRNWQFKIDVVTAGWTIYGIVERELEFDAGESFSSGAPVFTTRKRLIIEDGNQVSGVTGGGVIFVGEVSSSEPAELRRTHAHERMHVLQMDQLFLTFNEPYDNFLLRRLPYGTTINRWVDLNFSSIVMSLLSTVLVYSDRPWEIEANYLSR